jgi:hypothetical protein
MAVSGKRKKMHLTNNTSATIISNDDLFPTSAS